MSRKNLGILVVLGVSTVLALFVLSGKPKASAKSYEENVDQQLQDDLGLKEKPEIMGATVDTLKIGDETVKIQVVDSTQFVEVTGTNLPEMQSLQAAAQITGRAVISSTSIAGLGGGADIMITFIAKTGSDLFSALASQLVVLREDNNVYASGIGGYAPNGDPIFILKPQQAFFGLEQINGYWYRITVFRFGERKRFVGVPVINKDGLVSYPPILADAPA